MVRAVTGAAAPGAPDEAARHRALSSPSRVAILRVLREEGAPRAAEAVAERVGLHVSTAREHLEVLVGAGLASRAAEVRTTRGRPRTLYAAPGPAAPDGEPWLRDQLSRVLLAGYGRPLDEPGPAAERAAERLVPDVAADPRAADDDAARAGQLAALREHLARHGFDPELRGDEVRLHRCPVLDLAHERTDVVCGVHLGLARGVLARAGGPVRATGIAPFAGPGWCLLRLAGAADAAGVAGPAASGAP